MTDLTVYHTNIKSFLANFNALSCFVFTWQYDKSIQCKPSAELITNSVLLFTAHTYVPLKQRSYNNTSRKTFWFNKELRCLAHR